jgi:hypothetical protein
MFEEQDPSAGGSSPPQAARKRRVEVMKISRDKVRIGCSFENAVSLTHGACRTALYKSKAVLQLDLNPRLKVVCGMLGFACKTIVELLSFPR